MKIKNILISGLGVLALTACNDYLDVDTPSKYSIEDVFSSQKDANEALNGVYASVLAGNAFGQAYTYSLVLNSDVDYVSNSTESKQTNTPKRYDCDASSSTVNNVWKATYAGIENANNFIFNLENGSIYDEHNKEVMQMLGEAKVLRAMLYYELMCYWGDVPFTLAPTSATEDFAPAIESRDVIAKALVEDLAEAAPYMKYAEDNAQGVERASKEACWALIARISLQAAGYSLRHTAGDATSYGYMAEPDDVLKTYFLNQARTYADSVITSGKHSLKKNYQDVFYDECNMIVSTGDDVIFELPFAIEASGYIGYRQGPTFSSNGGETNYTWGECGGNQYVESFYRYSFAKGDARKYVGEGFWYYDYQGTPVLRASYGLHNLKWSKIWNTTSAYTNITTGNTGINYPYLRYADVLLMYAEADAKLTGEVNPEALAALKEVRERAFRDANEDPFVDPANAEEFLKKILDERKWEFAGENMRWKDLVRNNLLSETLYWTFMRNYGVAEDAGVGISWGDLIEEHDGVEYFDDRLLPNYITYIYVNNPAKSKIDLSYYQNTILPCLYVLNPEAANADLKTTDASGAQIHSAVQIRNNPQWWFDDMGLDFKAIKKPNDESVDKITWTESAEFFTKWYDEDGGYPQTAVRYSLYGYIRGGVDAGDYGSIYIIENGVPKKIEAGVVPESFPVVRYLLPIPREALRRGGYTNYYGY